ncbi:DUF805 domain-containing protein [Pleionea sediminis]|uniref:DUF805 domain-containing protein n=1 Tax=Pleionea sediminis TaxID=2569479 RepID=UPI001184B874|nr:DUF805 domain-containing protein [Pleionea sediminis]
MSDANPYQSPDSNPKLNGDVCEKMEFFNVSQRIGRVRYLAYAGGYYGIFIIPFGLSGGFLAIPSLEIVGMILAVITYIGLIVALVIVQIRRLHDLDKSGWYWLINLIPVINIIFALYVLFAPGTQGSNQFGPKPLPNNGGTWAAAFVIPVITIIGILAAIALPAYQDYADRENTTQMERQS